MSPVALLVRQLVAALLALLALTAAACSGAATPGSAPTALATTASSATTVPSPAATAAAEPADASLPPLDRFAAEGGGLAGPPPQQVAQVAIRVAAHADYDRVVLEFTGDRVPPYRIAYVTPPTQHCASGQDVVLPGDALLLVTLRDTVLFDEHARPTLATRELAPRLPAVLAVREICGFEAVTQWAIGVRVRLPFRVLELVAPARLVIDVAH